MDECDFTSRILEEFQGNDYSGIETLLHFKSESLANQFKSDASDVLHSKNRQYAAASETVTENNHEVVAATSVDKIDASDNVLPSKNPHYAASLETIIASNHEIAAGKIKEPSDRSLKVVYGNPNSQNNETATEEFKNPDAKNNDTSTVEFKNAEVKNNKTTAEVASASRTVRKITIKIKRSDPSLRFVYGNSDTKNNETATEEFNNPDIKNNETSTVEFNNPDAKNNEITAEELNIPNRKNNETVAEELVNANTKKNNEMVDEESSFAESSKTKIKKRKAYKKRSSEPSNKRKKKTNNNGSISPQPEVEEPELPLEFKEKIEQMGGIEVKLVIQKELTNSDLTQNHGRLSIPKGRVEESFLTPAEESYLDYDRNKKDKIAGMYVSMLDHNLNLWDEMCLKKWKMETAEVYNITEGWNELVAENGWKKDDKVLVQLWSFRRNHRLYFALVKL